MLFKQNFLTIPDDLDVALRSADNCAMIVRRATRRLDADGEIINEPAQGIAAMLLPTAGKYVADLISNSRRQIELAHDRIRPVLFELGAALQEPARWGNFCYTSYHDGAISLASHVIEMAWFVADPDGHYRGRFDGDKVEQNWLERFQKADPADVEIFHQIQAIDHEHLEVMIRKEAYQAAWRRLSIPADRLPAPPGPPAPPYLGIVVSTKQGDLTAQRNGATATFGRIQFQILCAIFNAAEIGIDRDKIKREVWGNAKRDGTNLDNHKRDINKKLEPLGVEIGDDGHGKPWKICPIASA